MRKSLINRRAAKAADSMWRRKGMFSHPERSATHPATRPATRKREQKQKPANVAGKPDMSQQEHDACPDIMMKCEDVF